MMRILRTASKVDGTKSNIKLCHVRSNEKASRDSHPVSRLERNTVGHNFAREKRSTKKLLQGSKAVAKVTKHCINISRLQKQGRVMAACLIHWHILCASVDGTVSCVVIRKLVHNSTRFTPGSRSTGTGGHVKLTTHARNTL